MLHDVDKNSDDRGSPQPNSHDNLVPGGLMGRGTPSMNYTTVNPNTTANKAIQLGLGRLIQVGTTVLINNGATQTVNTTPHGLTYAPYIIAALNNAIVTGVATPVNVVLPTWTVAGITGGNVFFNTWLYPMVDATNVYFNFLNATGNPYSITITYYLYQQRGSQ